MQRNGMPKQVRKDSPFVKFRELPSSLKGFPFMTVITPPNDAARYLLIYLIYNLFNNHFAVILIVGIQAGMI